jgi:hypothetical protein
MIFQILFFNPVNIWVLLCVHFDGMIVTVAKYRSSKDEKMHHDWYRLVNHWCLLLSKNIFSGLLLKLEQMTK